jgi:hypothetical protein
VDVLQRSIAGADNQIHIRVLQDLPGIGNGVRHRMQIEARGFLLKQQAQIQPHRIHPDIGRRDPEGADGGHRIEVTGLDRLV